MFSVPNLQSRGLLHTLQMRKRGPERLGARKVVSEMHPWDLNLPLTLPISPCCFTGLLEQPASSLVRRWLGVAGPQAGRTCLGEQGGQVPGSQRRRGTVGRDLAPCDGFSNNHISQAGCSRLRAGRKTHARGPASLHKAPTVPCSLLHVLGPVTFLPPPQASAALSICPHLLHLQPTLGEGPMALSFVPWDFCVTSFLLTSTGRQKWGCHKGSRTGFKRYFQAGVSGPVRLGKLTDRCAGRRNCAQRSGPVLGSWEASSRTLALPS